MPRIRTIKPEMFDDADLGVLPPLTRWVFAGLLVQADREGRLVDDPRRLKVRIMPYDTDPIEPHLEALVQARFLVRYRVEGRAYLAIRTFTRHQYCRANEPLSTLPAPQDLDQAPTLHQMPKAPVGTHTLTHASPSGDRAATGRRPGGDLEGKGREGKEVGKGEGRIGATAPDPVPPGTPAAGAGVPDVPGQLYDRFRQRAAALGRGRLPLTPRPAEGLAAIDLVARYPDVADQDRLVEAYLTSSHPPLRQVPATMGQLAKWASWLEAETDACRETEAPSSDPTWRRECAHDPPCGARAQHRQRLAIEAEKARQQMVTA